MSWANKRQYQREREKENDELWCKYLLKPFFVPLILLISWEKNQRWCHPKNFKQICYMSCFTSWWLWGWGWLKYFVSTWHTTKSLLKTLTCKPEDRRVLTSLTWILHPKKSYEIPPFVFGLSFEIHFSKVNCGKTTNALTSRRPWRFFI